MKRVHYFIVVACGMMVVILGVGMLLIGPWEDGGANEGAGDESVENRQESAGDQESTVAPQPSDFEKWLESHFGDATMDPDRDLHGDGMTLREKFELSPAIDPTVPLVLDTEGSMNIRTGSRDNAE